MSLDALLSQAGIPPDEVLEMLPDTDEPPKSPEQKKAEALKSAAALADLPGMPGFLKPTRTSAAAEAARADEEKKQQQVAEEVPAGTATATVDAAGSNGQGFKVTVMVSPDDEAGKGTSKEAAELLESATASKPEPNVFDSPYGNGSGLDARYYPHNQAAGSGFGGASQPSTVFDPPLSSAPLGDRFDIGLDAVPFDVPDTMGLGGTFSGPFGPRSAMSAAMPVPGANAPGIMAGSEGGFGTPGVVTYDPGAALPPTFPSSEGFAPFDPARPPLSGDGFGIPVDGVPLTDEEAAAQAAAAMAAQNAAMVDAMVQFGPDAVPEEDKKRFFGKKKRERAAKKAAAEAAALAAANAAAAAEAAAAEEAARRQPTAYIPTAPPAPPVASSGEAVDAVPVGFDPALDAMGTTQIPMPASQPTDVSALDAMASPAADMSGYDHFAVPPAGASAYATSEADPSVTTGMPPVGTVMGADGSYLTDGMGMPLGYDQYGYPSDGTGVTPEGVAALEAMRSEMNDASDAHRKRVRTIKIAVASVVGVLVVALITVLVLVSLNVISPEVFGIHINNEAPQNSNAASSSISSSSFSYHSMSSSSASSSSNAASSSDSSNGTSDPVSPAPAPSPDPGGSSPGAEPSSLAGDEVYHYTLTTIDGEHPQVTEVVTFDTEGFCLQTAMDAVFSSATAAQAFVERVRADYGSNFLSGSVDGTTAHVVVNMERAKLTREGYENALRGVVDGLEIERLA